MIGEKRDQYILNVIRRQVQAYKMAVCEYEVELIRADFRISSGLARLSAKREMEARALAEIVAAHEELLFKHLNCVMCGEGTPKENKVCGDCESLISGGGA